MRRAARTDGNQAAIVKALRDAGCTVAITSGMGAGFPDLVVGLRCRNFLLEVKDGSLPPSRRQLTPDEQEWHREWRGQVVVVTNKEEAINVVTRGYP